MNIFQRIFGRAKSPKSEMSRAEIIGGGNSFSAWSGDAYSNDIYRGAVDAIARNAAKLKGSHVIKYHDNAHSEGDCRLNRILQIEPNPYMSAFDMLYKLVTNYFLYNNAFAYIQRDDRGQLAAVFPLNPVHAEFLSDTDGALYSRFAFAGGKEVILPYTDIIHLRRNFNGNDILGDPNDALSPALQLAHMQNEGIIEGIKSGASLRGILRRTQLSSAEMMKEIQRYVAKHKKSNDLIVDLDYISAALMGETDSVHIYNKPILSVVLEVRELLYQIIAARRGKWERAFVITTIADVREMKALADELRAEVVLINATLEECLQRIKRDPSRARSRALTERLAAEWFEKYNKSLSASSIPPTFEE